eukprot:TRINITY_DN2568_c0_g1_i1.p1 TRINITY_DN2568_c0_g1~~TRINITY_DN2568_c0_g1_i1.p1  ORF type:complete len:514 (+),score=104.39 TRINITY_DN2568_c0_g1_i1:51-1544(+)
MAPGNAKLILQAFQSVDVAGKGGLPCEVLKNTLERVGVTGLDATIEAAKSTADFVDYKTFVSELFELRPMKLILFGAPGSGKGTQCEMLKKELGLKHISTGDVLRDHVKRGTELGKMAKECMDAGKLVPDQVMLDLIAEETKDACNGWMIDGMPRTPVQAEAMMKMGLVPQIFVTLEVPDEVLEERITLRRLDPETGTIYHLKFKPPPEDPAMQARLIQRSDDTAEKLKTRLQMYHSNLNSVKDVYRNRGTLAELDGASGGIEGVSARVLCSVLKSRLPPKSSTPLRLVLFGAPGSGKGTQCEMLRDELGLKHISTGDVLRDHVKRGTELGKMAKEYMDAGKLVPDQVMLDLIAEETKDANNGWMIDGMPRTPVQAESMMQMGLVPDIFITLEVPDEVLEERITLRRLDPETGTIYHLKFKPPPEDETIKARLTQRSDDTAEKLKTRLQGYHSNLNSVKAIYKKHQTLAEIDGATGGISGVSVRLLKNLLNLKMPIT